MTLFSKSYILYILLLPRFQYVLHPTPHVPLLAPWRSLITWSSNCDPVLEIIRHIIRCKSFAFVIKWCCVFSQEQIGRGHAYFAYYTQKVLKVMLVSTPKSYCAGEMRIHHVSGQFLSYIVQTKMVIAHRVVKMMFPCATTLGAYFPEGNLVLYIPFSTRTFLRTLVEREKRRWRQC